MSLALDPRVPTVFALLAAPGLATAASFLPLGDLAGGQSYSVAYDVSADGSTVVGSGTTQVGAQAFRWTAATGMQSLGSVKPGSQTIARGVSADGTTVVGLDVGSGTSEAFSWSATGGMSGLGSLPPGAFTEGAWEVSADGNIAVGLSGGMPQAVRYEGGTITGLGYLPGGEQSGAFGISADGRVIVGFSDFELEIPGDGGEGGGSTFFRGEEAFRWQDGQMSGLGDLPGGTFFSRAYSASADGSVIVGYSRAGELIDGGEGGFFERTFDQAFRWTEATGMVGLGVGTANPDGGGSRALDVSGDGQVIVGSASVGGEFTGGSAAIWMGDQGPLQLFGLLVAQGATGLDGWTLVSAEAVSADGLTIVGWGYTNANPESQAWVARLDATVVPLPPTLLLLGSAVGLLGWRRRQGSQSA
ncbi:MAG: hypothetical protein JNK40_10875 [Chromatiales bacterium]|nr:hypothetical protein [Chromatiales bacterium]